MSQTTDIGWTDSTVNGSSGCDGCELYTPNGDGVDDTAGCYAKWWHERRLAKSFPTNYAERFDEVRMIPGRYAQAANWPDLRGKKRDGKSWLDGKPRHIFVGDMGDFLSAAVTDEFLERELLAAVISPEGRRHVWQWLTKRPERLASLSAKWGGLPSNVIAMTTVTNQRTAEVRIPQLLEVKCLNRGLSIEPLWSEVDLRKIRVDLGAGLFGCSLGAHHVPHMDSREFPRIHWVVVGGESRSAAAQDVKPMHPSWIVSLRDQCRDFEVPFFFKQWGEWAPSSAQPIRGVHTGGGVYVLNSGRLGNQGDWWDGNAIAMDRPGKKSAGRLLGFHEHNGMPDVRAAA